MIEKLNIKILTPQRIKYQSIADMAILPGDKGVLAVLPKHLPMIIKLKTGLLEVRNEHNIDRLSIDAGVARISPEGVDIVVNFSLNINNITSQEINNRITNIRTKIDTLADDDLEKSFFEQKLKYLIATNILIK